MGNYPRTRPRRRDGVSQGDSHGSHSCHRGHGAVVPRGARPVRRERLLPVRRQEHRSALQQGGVVSGLGLVLVVGGTVVFWVAARAARRKDAERLGRRLPPSKRFLVEERKLPDYTNKK